MSSVRVQKELRSGIYFLTLTVKNWYYIFDRHNRWDVLRKSLLFCAEKKNLKIHAWVFMLNHIHLLVEYEDVISFLRDFKSFTTREIKANILTHEPSILYLFEEKNQFSVWQKTNMPQKIETNHFYKQKYDYIHDNPVRKGYVNNAEDWKYSSANLEKLLPLTKLGE